MTEKSFSPQMHAKWRRLPITGQQHNNRGMDLHSEWGIIIAIIINRRSIIRVPESLGYFVWCVMCGSVRDAKKKKKKKARKWVDLGQENRKMKVLNHTGPFSALQYNRATLILHPEVTKHPMELQESIPRRKQQLDRPSGLPAASGRFSRTNTHHPLPYYLSLYFSVPPFPPVVYVHLLEAIMSMTHSTAFHYFLDNWKWLYVAH